MLRLAGGWAESFPRHSPDRLFAVAADIESYPRFLPWCRATRIVHREADRLEVENLFGAGPVQTRFRSETRMAPPEHLEITAADGPFHAFRLTWRFAALDGASGCRVTVDYAMAFRSALLGRLAALSRSEMERRVAQAFRDRVRAVFAR